MLAVVYIRYIDTQHVTLISFCFFLYELLTRFLSSHKQPCTLNCFTMCAAASNRPALVTTTFSNLQGGRLREHDHYFVLYNK